MHRRDSWLSRLTRRRGLRRVGMVAVAALSLLAVYTLPANAVHDAGVFQLDGNAQTSVDSSPTATEDWDTVCPTTSPPSRPASETPHCLGGTTADRHAFIADGFESGSDDIFKGGTDDADVTGWQWKQAKPSPDKADLENAFAAQYTISDPASAYDGHKLLYFGGDRLANDGNTNIGFWFFQNKVSTAGSRAVVHADGSVTCGFPSGCGFSGVHKEGNVSLGGSEPGACDDNPPAGSTCIPGDIFILSAFTNGGAQPTIKVFEWVGPGHATKDYLGSNNCFTSACTLQPLAIPNTPGFSDNRCGDATVTLDVACALVNTTSQPSPWLFKDKTTGAPVNTFGPAELYEGGLDLTDLGFAEACFSSTLLNTRSSQSGTSVLQDFALGQFGECGSTTLTTPQQKTQSGYDTIPAGGISIGAGSVVVRDQAQVTVTGVSNFGGTVTFSLCGPLAADSTSNCESGGVQVGSPVGVSPPSPATVNGPDTTLTSAGRYCWRAVYSGDSARDVPGSSDPPAGDTTTTTECFLVNPVTPTLATQASGPVTLGNAISDTATLTGAATQPGTDGVGPGGTINATNGAPAGGSITWKAYGPDDCTTVAMAETSRDVSGNGTYPKTAAPDNQAAVSFTPTAVGTFTFVARYSGNGPNTNSVPNSACPDTTGTETVLVTDTTSVTSQQDWLPNDTATVASAGGSALNGTMTFTLYPSADCTGTPVSGQTYTRTLTNATTLADRTKSTSNSTFKVTANASVSWLVSYNDNSANVGDSTPVCETSTLTIDNDVPVGP